MGLRQRMMMTEWSRIQSDLPEGSPKMESKIFFWKGGKTQLKLTWCLWWEE